MPIDVERPSNLSSFVIRERRTVAEAEISGLDLLRVRVEQAAASPAVIAVTSATTGDGREIAARGLAYSLSLAGYSTLFIDTALASRALPALPRGLAIEEIGRQQSPPDPASGKLALLTLNDITLQQTTSLRGMKAAVDILRSKFDYVVVSTEFGMSTGFGAAIAATADAVLVTLKKGRRKATADDQLAAATGLIGSRFTGVVEVDPSLVESSATVAVPDAAPHGRPRRTALPWIAPFARALSTRLAFVAAKAEAGVAAGNALRVLPAPKSPDRSKELAVSASSHALDVRRNALSTDGLGSDQPVRSLRSVR
jgi:hypothetical protein